MSDERKKREGTYIDHAKLRGCQWRKGNAREATMPTYVAAEARPDIYGADEEKRADRTGLCLSIDSPVQGRSTSPQEEEE